MRNLESLIEYFKELSKKVKEHQKKGEEEISERERWEVTQQDYESFEE